MNFETKLSSMVGATISDFSSEGADIDLTFSNSTKISAGYWRFIKDGMSNLSSFDHGQQYGLPSPIDAAKDLSDEIFGLRVERVEYLKQTADIEVYFENNKILQILRFTGYEVWEVEFADGTGELSNYMP